MWKMVWNEVQGFVNVFKKLPLSLVENLFEPWTAALLQPEDWDKLNQVPH